jgi:multisubunit Na+/H+ antiporter MnhG subunit
MHAAALACTWAGVVVIVLSAFAAAIAADTLPRLHYVTAITSIGGPLIGLGLCLQDGIGLTAASVVLAVILLAASGPVLSAAIARTAAQLDGILPPEEPQ